MTGGKKRSADEAGVATRGDGVKRRESSGSGKDTKGGPKVAQAIPASAFKARAEPLQVTVAHMPRTVGEDDNTSPAPVDAGFLGAVALQPCTFSTGSYGWKGSRRLAIDIVDPTSGEKNTVQVMLTINATVMGSKQAEKESEVEVDADPRTGDGGAVEATEQV